MIKETSDSNSTEHKVYDDDDDMYITDNSFWAE